MKTIKELVEKSKELASLYNLDYKEVSAIVAELRDAGQIDPLFNGNYKRFEEIAKSKHLLQAIEHIQGEEVEDLGAGELPKDIEQIIHNTIKDFCDLYGIEDISKPREGGSEDRWSAVCTYVGKKVFKELDIFRDKPLCKKQGGTVYDAERVSKAQDLYNYFCKLYQHAYSISDCAEFLGVARSYIYGNGSGELTPARAQFIKKAQFDREESNRRGAIGGRGGNPVGYTVLLNHDNGYNNTIHHTFESGSPTKQIKNYPTFEIEDKQNGANADI